VVAALAALAAVSASAAAGGRSAGPVSPAQLENPCRPATAACLSGAEAKAAKAAAAAASFTLSDSTLDALGLPDLHGVAGSREQAGMARLNGPLVAALEAPLTTGRSLSSATASPSDVVGASSDTTTQTGGVPGISRTVHLRAQSNLCPVMLNSNNMYGNISLLLHGSITLIGVYRSSRGVIRRTVSVSIPDLPEVEGKGYVDRNAVYSGSSFDDIPMAVHLRQEVSAGGKATSIESEGALHAKPAEGGGWLVEGGPTFEDVVDRWNKEEAGAPVREGVIATPTKIGSAFEGLGQQLMNLIDAQLRRVVAQAQDEGWQSPNQCARFEWNPQSAVRFLAPSKTMRLEGRIAALRGGPDGYSTWPNDPQGSVGEIVQSLSDSSRGDRPKVFEIMGDPPVNEFSVDWHWKIPSTVGIAEGDWKARWHGLPRAWHVHYTADFVTTPPEIESNTTGDLIVDQLVMTSLYKRVTGSVTWTPTSSGCSGELTASTFGGNSSFINFPDYPDETLSFSFRPDWHGSAQCTIDGAPRNVSPPDYVVSGTGNATNYETMSGGQTLHDIPDTETDHWQFTALK
jgi:hypothetical protein